MPEKYRALLEAELEQVTKQLSEIAVEDPTTGDWSAKIDHGGNTPEANDAADDAEEWGERRAEVSSLETRHRNLKRALNKIEAGTFGNCEISGEPIEEARLDANPAARTNIANRDREDELPL